jgi:hypothetical protein
MRGQYLLQRCIANVVLCSFQVGHSLQLAVQVGNEARILVRAQMLNCIPRVLEVHVMPNLQIVVMEHLEGAYTLQSMFQNHREVLRVRFAVIFKLAIDALQNLHTMVGSA